MENAYMDLSGNDFLAASSFLQTAESPMKLVYGASIATMCLIVTGVYFNRGFLIVFRVLAYLLALSTMTLTVKSVYVNHGYNFPKFVSCMHFISAGILCFGIMAWRKHAADKPIAIPSLKQMGTLITPTALAFACGIGANNLALLYANAAFVEMVGASSPVCVVGVSIAIGKGFNMKLIWPVLMVCLGIATCASGELKFSMLGFGLAVFATLARAIKTVLQHALMDGEEHAFDPIELLAWMSLPSIAVMMTWSVVTEGMEPWAKVTGETALPLILAIGITCVNACILNVANLFVIKDLGAVATQLAGQLKGILIVLGGVAMLGESVQLVQIAGYGFVLGGVSWYNKKDKELKEAKKAQSEQAKESTPLVK